ncbi:HPP family protein [Uliginosibacterium sp. sgz301328]|uniref:HPP family protein n=1 Tax=Uliginosibacterium sp. sgz301328 TaxID=3243764 RepID=UPI00359CFCD9
MKKINQGLRGVLRRLWPHALAVSGREMVVACMGATLGLMVTEWIGRHGLGTTSPWFIAPLGASAVLLFGVPASPLAQPWSIVGGNLVAAIIGVTVAKVVPDPGLAAGLAAGLAIAVMFKLRCLHPPSGAVALTAVLGGPAVTDLGYQFVLHPVLLDSVALAALAIVFNNLAGRRYPHHLAPGESRPANPPIAAVSITRDDLHAALIQGELLDIDEDDLEDILIRAEQCAHDRLSGRSPAPTPAGALATSGVTGG